MVHDFLTNEYPAAETRDAFKPSKTCPQKPSDMVLQVSDRIASSLQSRIANGLIRTLREADSHSVDFSSNDYLGLARPGPFQRFLSERLRANPPSTSGATGSRLLTGHSSPIVKFETQAAAFHHVQSALLFSSGYDANLATLSTLPGPEDAVVHDALIHASMHDGLRLSRARDALFQFAHNDVADMQARIEEVVTHVQGSVFIVVETVYSMDGDVAPLSSIMSTAAHLERRLGRQIRIIADEAHAVGLFGPCGEGLLFARGLHTHPNLLATVVTFGKAFAAHGAVVLARSIVRDYLINYARPLIYSTAPPPHTVTVLSAAYDFAVTEHARVARRALWTVVDLFDTLSRRQLPARALLPSAGRSPIQAVIIPGNRAVVEATQCLRAHGFDVYPIRSPTIPRGTERIRIVLHAHNDETEIVRLVDVLTELLARYQRKARL